MAEAEEVITDVARHATAYAQDLWRRHRSAPAHAGTTALRDVAQRLDLLLSAVYGRSFVLRPAEPPAPATLLTKVFRRSEGPRVSAALPATDGHSIWLPAVLREPLPDGLALLRVLALQQAQRATRGSPSAWRALDDPLERTVFLVLEAQAADAGVVRLLPGMARSLGQVRSQALARRPALAQFPGHRRPLERFVRSVMEQEVGMSEVPSPAACLALARDRAASLRRDGARPTATGRLLYRDLWTGELRPPAPGSPAVVSGETPAPDDRQGAPRSARLPRRPQEREAPEDEDDRQPGAWMVQTAQPHEQAEDPFGLQRPTDRDESTAAEELADALSELPEARLVTSPGRPKEVLLSDDAPQRRTWQQIAGTSGWEHALRYPEWDCVAQAYREHGVTVHVGLGAEGPQAWVDAAIEEHRSTAQLVKRRFEMLKAQRVRLHKQLDGDEVDLEAYIAGYSDFRAGHPLPQGLYLSHRQARRDMAIMLLVDISGSTDGWVAAHKRVIDVEREALLLVSIALQGMAEPNAILAFSGEGPHGVVVRIVKLFEEPFNAAVARRIARLEPEHYTRAGAAIRHATALLMRQQARHRLLLLLSDGKPNDVDEYEGRYGAADMRQAVTEARLQGVQPFCLTVDRQAAAYLPGIFGAHQYALLPGPQLLPTVLLAWIRRLLLS